VLAIEQIEDEVLLLIETVISQAHGILDNVEELPFIFLIVNLKIRTDLEPDRFSAFGRVIQVFGVGIHFELPVVSDQSSAKSQRSL
jgi:hypothetical protein